MSIEVSVIIITHNEECNISAALTSVCGWARNVFVVDSFSTDETLTICQRYACHVVQNQFLDFAQQWNWALDHLPIDTEWIFFLDADEWMPEELKTEIEAVISQNPKENGFMLRWRFIWMGKWIRRGYYPKWLMRLVRHGQARWEIREINPHLIVNGSIGRLDHDFMHENRKGLRHWSEKHVGYAFREAEQLLLSKQQPDQLQPHLMGSQAQRVRWIRLKIYNRLPLFVRPLGYFFYRVVIRGGFLDGWQALMYHFLHAFWCPLLIDLFYREIVMEQKQSCPGPLPQIPNIAP